MIESEYLKDNLKYVERLKKIPSLEYFSEKDLKGILEMSKLRQYEPGEVIMKEGGFDSCIFFLMSGKLKVVKNDESLSILKRTGDVFGEMALLEDLPRSATTIAHTSVITLEINRDDFLNYIHKNSGNGVKILLKLSRILSSRLRETDVKLKTFVSLSRWL